MPVETFEIEEVAEETPIECAEAQRLIEELGLAGQKPKEADPDSDTPRIPYREMTKEETAVYRTLCPQETRIEDYDAGAIPLRVLQVAAHAKQFFKQLYVWHPAGQERDPVLVAHKGESWMRDYYILARWGEELDEWPALLKRAARAHGERVIERLETISKKVTRAINDMCDGCTVDEFLEKHDLPSFNW